MKDLKLSRGPGRPPNPTESVLCCRAGFGPPSGEGGSLVSRSVVEIEEVIKKRKNDICILAVPQGMQPMGDGQPPATVGLTGCTCNINGLV
jgi:hypothetical protein